MTVRAVLFEAHGAEREVELEPKVLRSLGRDRLLWIDVDGPEDGELRATAETVKVPLPVRPRSADPERPHLWRHEGWIRLRLNAIQGPADGPPGSVPLDARSLDLIAGPNVVITIHEGAIDAIDTAAAQLRGESGLGRLDAAALLAVIADEVLNQYLRHVESIERRIDVLDELAIRGGAVDTYLNEVVILRRRGALLRRLLAPHREAFGPLARPDFEVAALGRPWPGLVDRLELAIVAIESVRDLLIGSVELHQSSTSQRVNDVMKRLTILNAVLLPAVVLA
ncbi:MAG: CorA family divalent cation transporter, partial [Candidatus Limnocylindrales bacterium]